MTSISHAPWYLRLFRPAVARPREHCVDLLPIVDDLIAAATHSDRAVWLLQCPQSILLKSNTEIRWALRKAKFAAGLAYLEVELSALSSVRQGTGKLRMGTESAVSQMRRDLIVIAEGRTP